MTSEELNEITTAVENMLSKRYDDTLVDLGNMQQRYHDAQNEAIFLGRSVHKLTTSNKSLTCRNMKLTNQLAEAKQKVSRLNETSCYLIEIITRARQISPEVSALFDKIIDEVNPLLKNDI